MSSRPAADVKAPAAGARVDALRTALAETRHAWRWHWGRFWTLRWENTLRRPGWRAEEENNAWHRMRDEVRRYAALRAQLRELERQQPLNPPLSTREAGGLSGGER
jgi:hypothetical protein